MPIGMIRRRGPSSFEKRMARKRRMKIILMAVLVLGVVESVRRSVFPTASDVQSIEGQYTN